MKKGIASILKYAAPYKKAFILGCFFSVACAVIKLLIPDQIRKIMNYLQDNISGSIDPAVIRNLAVIALILMTASFLFDSIQSVILSGASQRLSHSLKNAINEKLDRLPLAYFINRQAGDLQSCMTNDVDVISTAMSNNASSVISAFATLVICLFMMLKTNVILTVVTVINSILGIFITLFVMKKSGPHAMKQQALLGAVNSEVYESFNGHLVIKAFNCENDVIDHFRKTNHALSESGWKASFFQSVTMPLMMLVANMGYIVIAVTGTVLMIKGIGTTSLGDIVAFIIYSNSFSNPLKALASAGAAFTPAIVASERIDEVMNEEEIKDIPDAVAKDDVKGNVVFDHVRFGYVPGQVILKDLCASVSAGQKIAIVGPTGAGKSTMVNLLMRFYEPQSGRILLDGIPITDYSEEGLHSMLGMVLQDTWTFEGSIRDNIIYSTPDITEERFNRIIDDIGIRHLIETLPDGADTILSENSAVSAGQKQLITIGRAMAKNAPVLILDEATSSVDTRTEKLIQNALDKLSEGRTSFVIAHRLSTIKNADQIFVMKDGDVIEIGTHKELLQKGGLYAELYNSQFKGA